MTLKPKGIRPPRVDYRLTIVYQLITTITITITNSITIVITITITDSITIVNNITNTITSSLTRVDSQPTIVYQLITACSAPLAFSLNPVCSEVKTLVVFLQNTWYKEYPCLTSSEFNNGNFCIFFNKI